MYLRVLLVEAGACVLTKIVSAILFLRIQCLLTDSILAEDSRAYKVPFKKLPDSIVVDVGTLPLNSKAKFELELARAKMRQSMSRAGDCYDNAFMESCFGTIKTELEMSCYSSLNHARREIEEYINYYNAIRRHSSLDYQSPTSFELALTT